MRVAEPTHGCAVAILAAAGRGERLRAGGNKVFLPLAGVPLLGWALHGLRECPDVAQIVLVVGPGEELQAAEVAFRCAVDCRIVAGADSRAGSVRAGLEAAREFDLPIVAIHDAARPFVTPELVTRTIRCAEEWGATGASRAVTDTIKLTEPDGTVRKTLPREALRAMQTPQTFRLAALLAAYEQLGDQALTLTDDCAVMEAAGQRVVLCEGDTENIKVTERVDLVVAESIARNRQKPPYRGATSADSEELARAPAPTGGSDTDHVSSPAG
jgi:2-C-methyl-D-erythritol 4-phosphate cytidylyltransferase